MGQDRPHYHISGTLAVDNGGTGATSATAYAVLCGGTTSTGAFQSIASVGTSGQYLGSNGAGALPSMKALAVSGVTLSAGQYPGTTTNDNATAGNEGEFVSTTVVSGSAVALTTGTAANIGSISLTAGDWDVWVNARYTGGATTTVTTLTGSISTTSATLDTSPGRIASSFHNGQSPFASTNLDLCVGQSRFSLSGTTTVYFVAQSTFGTSTCSAYGQICARRRR